MEDTLSFSMSDPRDTPDRYYHQLSSTGSYQSISYMGLSDDDDDEMMIVERHTLKRNSYAASSDNLDTASPTSSYKASTENLDEETKPYLEKLVSYKDTLLPYCPNSSDEEDEERRSHAASSCVELEHDELELDELESQYMLSDQFEVSQYQITKSQTRLKQLQEQYEEFQDRLLEEPLAAAGAASGVVIGGTDNSFKAQKSALEAALQPGGVSADIGIPSVMPLQVPDSLGSSDVHIDLHKAFLKECRNLDTYLGRMEEKEMTRHNIQHMGEYVNKLRDLYMAFLINHIDQKYQILSLKNSVSDIPTHKADNKTSTTTHTDKKSADVSPHEHSKNVKTGDGVSSGVDAPQKSVDEQKHPNHPNKQQKPETTNNKTQSPIKDSSSARNRRAVQQQQPISYSRPHVLILKNTNNNKNNKNNQPNFKAQKSEIEAVLQPQQNGINIKSIGPTRQGGLVLSFHTENECKIAHDILTQQPNLQLQVTLPSTIHPKMVIQDIGNQWNVQELKRILLAENPEIGAAVGQGETFDIVFLSKEGEVIIKVSPPIRNILKQVGRVLAAGESYKVSDRIFVKRCYRCHQFGHFSSACMFTVQKCGHCNGNHPLKDCNHKEDLTKAICINCTKSKLHKNKANHRPSDPQCPSLLYEQQKTINKTDYGCYGY